MTEDAALSLQAGPLDVLQRTVRSDGEDAADVAGLVGLVAGAWRRVITYQFSPFDTAGDCGRAVQSS